MTPEELLKIAKEYLDYPQAKSLRTGWQDAVSFAEYIVLSVNLEEQRKHFCIRCHHRWEGDHVLVEYCGDCHRECQALKVQLEAAEKLAQAQRRLISTLEVAHAQAVQERHATWEKMEATKQERDELLREMVKIIASRGEVVTTQEPLCRCQIGTCLLHPSLTTCGMRERGAVVKPQTVDVCPQCGSRSMWTDAQSLRCACGARFIKPSQVERGEVVNPLSGQPCGCDPAANWTCERHSTMPLEHQ